MKENSKDSKITFLKEKVLEKKALKNFKHLKNNNVSNPISNEVENLKMKFEAFQKTKKEVESDDLF